VRAGACEKQMETGMENQALDTSVVENGGQGEVVGAQEQQENPFDGGQGGFVDAQGEETEEAVGGAGERQTEESPENASQGRLQRRQSPADNAAARAARMRAEKDTEERMRKQYDESVAGMGIPNPYTGKPFSSFEEFAEYGKRYKREELRKRAAEQGRTVEEVEEEEENRSFITRKRKEEEAQKAERARQEQRVRFMTDDLNRFVERHPNVDVARLEQNQKFRLFAGNRLYKEPLAALYEDFVQVVGDAERAALAKAESRSRRSTGGGQGGGGVSLTAEQAAALEEWNRDNPEMRMTAKEFMNR